jgi:predicted nucleotidyltransferase
MSLNKEKIFQTIIENQSSIKLLGVKNLALFGSFVRNEQKENSDIDFLVEFNDGQSSYDNYIELSFLLEDIFKRKIDLLTPKSMSPYIGPYILKELEYVALSA